jgi:hypothetical protein
MCPLTPPRAVGLTYRAGVASQVVGREELAHELGTEIAGVVPATA